MQAASTRWLRKPPALSRRQAHRQRSELNSAELLQCEETARRDAAPNDPQDQRQRINAGEPPGLTAEVFPHPCRYPCR